MSRSRQLAAIMFTDIKGYTALMQQDEEKAIQARNKHRLIFNAANEKYHGRILQYYGDGTLSIFDSALDAVQCGIEMQHGFLTEPKIPVRIGIHTGDIIFSEEEIIGDSVNVASRIESLAVPGSVFISDKVYDEIKNQTSIKTIRLKTVQLKNVARPIEVFAITNTGLIVPPPEEIKGKTEPPPSPKSSPTNEYAQNPGMPFLATKLFTPPLRPKSVLRPRLIERLNRGLFGKLTLISAPAGFGKTTIVSEWIPQCERSASWLSLDEADSNPTRFTSYLIAALQKIKAGLGENALSRMQSPQPPPIESTLALLINEIATIPDNFLLVLDDYHLIDSQLIDQALAFLLDHLPPQLHLVIITREDPNLPLARLRVRGQLTELRVNDLRFTNAEAAGFLNQAMGLQLSEEAIAKLENRTEGWIAGLQMAALSMQSRSDAASFIEAFTGSHHFIIDYLVEEVLQQQPEATRHFLLQTSILERLSAPLCDAVTNRTDSITILENLEKGNLFVIPLDDNRQWYRYHHLFADVLQARLVKELPQELSNLHQRASQWYEQQNLPADAIRHALTGKNFEQAARLIELAWPIMDGNFQTPTWLKWTKALPEELLHSRPVLLVGCAWSYLNEGQLESGTTFLQKAERLLELEASPDLAYADEAQFKYLPGSIATAWAYHAQAQGDFPGSIQYAQYALDAVPEGEHIRRGPAAALLGLVHWANGELEAAHQAIQLAMENFQMAGSIVFAISGTFGMADIRLVQGRLRDAIRTYERSLELLMTNNQPKTRGIADLHLGLSDLHRERHEIELAIQELQKSEQLGEGLALPDWACRCCIAKARLQEAQGDSAKALEWLDEAESLYYRSPIPVAQPIAAQKAKLYIKQHELSKAINWAKAQQLSFTDTPNFLNEFELLTFARLQMAIYQKGLDAVLLQKTIHLLDRLEKAATEGERMGSLIAILIQKALAYTAKGATNQALSALEHALHIAAPEGFVRIFLDEGPAIYPLLAAAQKQEIEPDFVNHLLALTTDSKATSNPKKSQPLLEPLSERELEVLQLVAQGLSNREISERLFLALSTIKGHNQKIFEKLDVQRRTEAVAKARALGVI